MEISPSQHGAPTRSQQDSTRGEARLSKPTYLPEDLTAELEIRVRALYADKSVLPQHNFEHVLQVREAVKPLIERCEKAGIPIDRVALDHAILLHDLLYAVDHQKLGFESKEALSADYAEKLLLELGAPLEHARKVKEIILATHHQKEPQTPEEILIRAADLSNLAGDYKSFRATTHRLHEESRINGNAGISFQEFVVRSYRFLSFFTASQLELTDGARTSDGKSEWHENVFSNLQRLHAEAFGTEEQSVLVIVGREALDRVMLEPPRAG
ncbi:MAG: hypothetical protein KDD64_14780, partial [Bdellovibrionales bacterium]|nr:hypothetical protein [Bdellovibrionales bacterium]